jgi:uncharacterized protein (DUF2249 family)
MTAEGTTGPEGRHELVAGAGREILREGERNCIDETLRVDVRGLEPPLPMLRILELLDRLSPGQRLVVTHERRPVLLYPQLEERGFAHQTKQAEPGEVQITIWREEG